MRSWFQGIFALLLTIASPLLYAVQVHSIYQAEIPVATQSDEDKLQAEQDALAEVLIKISGNSHLLENNPNLSSNLKNADNFVEDYSYSTPAGAPKSARYLLFVRFDDESVNRLLHETGAPVWGLYRPLVLVWLALQTPNHAADIIDPATSDLPKLLKKTAKHRGLPVIFPMMDVTDLTHVSVNDISEQSIMHVQQASARYASNAILVGKITQNPNLFTSHWQLVLGTDHWSWDISGKTMQDVMTSVVANVTDTFATHYGVLMSNTVQSQLTMIVVGVKQQKDFVRLMKYIQHLAPVATVQLKTITEDEVTLDVSLSGKREAFMQTIALGKNLQPISVDKRAEGSLAYKWVQ